MGFASKTVGACLIVTALILACPGAATAETVVIYNPSSGDPRTAPSSSDDPVIILGDNEQAAVSTPEGGCELVYGRVNGRLSKLDRRRASASLCDPFNKAVASNNRRGESLPAGVEVLDISLDTETPQCYVGKPERVWQLKPSDGSPILLSRKGGKAVTVALAEGHTSAAWPVDVDIVPGGEYVVSHLGPQGTTVQIQLIKLPTEDTKKVSVGMLSAAKCDAQALLLARKSIVK